MADDLPDPRKKLALPFAASGLLYIIYACDKPEPSKTDTGTAVQELKEICNSAGIVLADGSFRAALTNALESFDPNPGLHEWRFDKFLVLSR